MQRSSLETSAAVAGTGSARVPVEILMPKPLRLSEAKKLKTDLVSGSTRIVLSSHETLVRSGIRALLERIKEVEVREALDNQQLLTLIAGFNPHVVLLDVTTRGLDGLVLLTEVVQRFPSTGALALIQDEDEEQAVLALRLGAAGLIAKSATSTELEFAVKTVARGENYLSKKLEGPALKFSETPKDFWPKLTLRQQEVLKMFAEGQGTKEIALRLNISVKTVESHRARIMTRLNIRDIAGLVRYAIRIGLIKLDE